MDFSQILQMLGQGMGGAAPGGQPGGGGSGGGNAGIFGNWSPDSGAGLSAYNPNPGPMTPFHSSGIMSSILGEPQQQPNPMGGGLHELLMRLGLMQPRQQ